MRWQWCGALDASLMALSVASQPLFLTLIAPLLRIVVGIDLAEPRERRMVIEHVSEFVRRGLEPRSEVPA